MINFHVIDREGRTFSLVGEPGISVMEAIRSSGEGDIVALCGGMKSCATCHVYVDEAWLAKTGHPDEDEEDLLDASDDRRPNSRLSCQISLSDGLDGLTVTIAPES